MKSGVIKVMPTRAISSHLCTVVFFLCAVFFASWAGAADTAKTRAVAALERMEKLVYADMEITLTDKDKEELKAALLSDKILPEDKDAPGSHLFAVVTFMDQNKARMIVGVTGAGETGREVLVMLADDHRVTFDITQKNLAQLAKVSTKIANGALEKKATNLEKVVSSFAYRIADNTAEISKPVKLTAEESKELPKLLQTDTWKLTDNFDPNNVKAFNTVFIRSPEDEDETRMAFSSSNGLYFITLYFYNDFETIMFEVPKQAFINLDLQN